MSVALLVVLGSFTLLVYTYVGYPVLLGLLARLRPQRVLRDDGYEPRVSVLIPAYNVEAYLESKLDSLLAQDYPVDKVEILVFSDGSTDGTNALLERRAAADPRVRAILSAQRGGKPSAMNAMREAATGEVLICTDSRQPLAPGAFRALVRAFADPKVGCVSGNLILDGAAGSGVYWAYENWIRQQEARFRSMVGVTGPLYAVRKVDLPVLPHDVILDDVWVPMGLRLQGRKVLFEEGAVAYDQAFADEREFGRKARTLAGNYQLFARMPSLLVPILNPSWFETFSHKILRLVAPWFLVLLLGASVAGALAPAPSGPPWARALLAALLVGQSVFYVAALVGPRVGRVPGVARTFVVLNAAAVVGLWRFLRGAQKVTW